MNVFVMDAMAYYVCVVAGSCFPRFVVPKL